MANISLIWGNIRQNFKPHLLFFSIHTFFGMVYLWSEMLTSHPWFGKFLNLQEIDILDINQLRSLFLGFLLWSASYQIASRRGTATADMLDDASWKQMRSIIFGENLLLGLASWLISIIIGTLLSLLVFPLFGILMETPTFPFIFPVLAIAKSALFFIPAFVANALLIYFFLYPKKKVWNAYGKWQSYTWVIVAAVLLLGLYLYVSFFASPSLRQSVWFYLFIGFFFVGAIILLVILDRKIGYISIFSNQRFFGGLTGKILVVFLAVLSFLSSIQEMKILFTSYQTQQDYYQENAYTFYLEALYQDKSKLPIYEQELEQELKQKKVTYHKQQVDFLVLEEADGVRSPLTLSYSQYEKVAKQLGQPKPTKLKENEAIYFFTSVNSSYQKKSEIDEKSIAFIGYPTAFHLKSKIGSFIPGYDVMVVADEVYAEIRNVESPNVNYAVPDRYVLYMVPAWMKKNPTYASPELQVGTKLINQIEKSPKFISNQDHILNGYVGENKNYELTVRSPYGMGVNDIHFLFLSLLRGLISLIWMLFLYDRRSKQWWISFYYPLSLAIAASFVFSIDKVSITAIAVIVQVVWIHLFFSLVSKKRFHFYR
ncbi:hypothetical protein MK805_05205 [Shimazuella sp. AN120528]|uniref:hypothetical protein n=1 Tax=Shimazuella soli TaxID=1892854 RepID=UPI001F108A3F|nr:hypothetical protein [Shimazuella soli]MCH5584367.1 hypothetical protein [Shimazuella soli]